MKKILSKLLVFSLILNLMFPGMIFNSAHAETSNWDFSVPGDYTISDSTKVDINSGIVDLIYNLEHQGSIVNGGSVLLDGATRVTVDSGYAYVAAYNSDAIEIIDVSDPTNPTHVSSISNGGSTLLNGPRGVAISGDILYVSSYLSDAIEIIDVSNKSSPVHTGSISRSATIQLNGPRGLVLSGSELFVASYVDDALEIIDVSDPTNPTHISTLIDSSRLDGARSLALSGNLAYVTSDRNDSMQVINIANTSSPTFSGQIVNGGSTLLDGARGIAIKGNHAYVASNISDALEIIDISNPTTPSHSGSIINGSPVLLNGARGVVIDGNFAHIASNSSDSVETVDISDPANPVHESSISKDATVLLNGARDIVQSGSYIYVSSFVDDALEILKAGYDDAGPSIEPNEALSYSGDINSITETLGTNNQGNITYQLSKDDGVTWYYYNGVSWNSTTTGATESTSASTINTNISGFNALGGGTNKFKWKAFLNSNGTQIVELDQIDVDIDDIILPPDTITAGAFHFDAQDIDGDNDFGDNPANGANVGTWTDKFNTNDATQTGGPRPTYDTGAINGHQAVNFNGTNEYLIVADSVDINTTSYSEKSFAIVFKTGDDVDTLQNVYEQGGTVRGYAIQIQSGSLYAGVWNTSEWDVGHQYKVINLGSINTNAVYSIIMTQDSTSGVDATNTLEIYFNGILHTTLTHVDIQQAHTGDVGFGRVTNDAINLKDETAISGDSDYFKGYIGELISWNHALSTSEASDTNLYFKDRWSIDTEDPTITASFPEENDLYPYHTFDISFDYSDNSGGIGIDTSSDNLTLHKWNTGSGAFGPDIAPTYINFTGSTITTTGSTYPTSNLPFGKYQANFDIQDISGNMASTGIIFYVDEPEFSISTGSLDIGNLQYDTTGFSSPELLITVKTVGAPFNVILNKNTNLTTPGTTIPDWDGVNGFGYDKDPYSSTISTINTNEIIGTNTGGLNTDGEKNSFIYKIKLGALVEEIQQAGGYTGSIDIGVDYDY